MQQLLEQYNSTELKSGTTLAELIRRPELSYEAVKKIDPKRPALPAEVTEQVNINLKYGGYIKRQLQQVEKFRRMESRKLSIEMDYSQVPSLRLEAVQKLNQFKPSSVGQASRISGVTPADISVLLIYLEQKRRNS